MGAPSMFPYAGSILAKIVGAILQNPRLREPDRDLLERKMRAEEFVDLFEDGAFQAARALTDEREEHIAALLENSLSSSDLGHLQEKQLLSLLGQLDDAELIILKHFGLD